MESEFFVKIPKKRGKSSTKLFLSHPFTLLMVYMVYRRLACNLFYIRLTSHHTGNLQNQYLYLSFLLSSQLKTLYQNLILVDFFEEYVAVFLSHEVHLGNEGCPQIGPNQRGQMIIHQSHSTEATQSEEVQEYEMGLVIVRSQV